MSSAGRALNTPIRLIAWSWRATGWARGVIAFLAVWAAYGAYCLTVRAWVEPAANLPSASAPVEYAASPAPVSAVRNRLASLLPEGSWELRNPTTIESKTSILLLREYETLANGNVFIKPCTFVYFPGDASGELISDDRRYLMIRVPEGAELTFDPPFSLRNVGKLVGGRLQGTISVAGQTDRTGADGDFSLTARDAQLTPEHLWSPHEVAFRWRGNEGTGRELRVEFANDATSAPGQFANLGSMSSLQLSRDVSLELDLPPNAAPSLDFTKATIPNRQTRDLATPGSSTARDGNRIRVNSQGPFRFSIAQRRITFQDHVDVLRFRTEGATDQLLCEYLEIGLGPKTNETLAVDERATKPLLSNLEPKMFTATGLPVVLSSPSDEAEIRCQTFQYDLSNQSVMILGDGRPDATEGSPLLNAVLRRQGAVLRAPQVEYQHHADHQVGQLFVTGKGDLSVQDSARADSSFSVRWTKSLRLRPRDGRQLLSVLGDGQVTYVGQGSLRAEEIWLWLIENPPGDSSTMKTLPDLVPDYVLATGHVHGDSRLLDVETDELKAWFHFPDHARVAVQPLPQPRSTFPLPAPNGAPRGGVLELQAKPSDSGSRRPVQHVSRPAQGVNSIQPRDPFAVAPLSAEGQAEPNASGDRPEPGQHFHVSAPRMRLQFRVIDNELKLTDGELLDRDPSMSATALPNDGGAPISPVEVIQTAAASAPEQPVAIRGNHMVIKHADTPRASVLVEGTPARLEAQGSSLEGALIQADQGDNRLWVEGAGRMRFPVEQDFQGQPLKTPQMAEIVWRDAMEFDGLVLKCNGKITATANLQEIHADLMEVTLATPFSFQQDQARGAMPRPSLIRFLGSVYARNDTYAGQTLTSIDHLTGTSLSLDVNKNVFVVEGPGSVTTWRKGVKTGGLFQPTGLPVGSTRPATSRPDDGLSYLHMRFQDKIDGQAKSKELTLQGRIEGVFGPVADWNTEIPLADPRQLTDEQFRLDCGQLVVRDMSTGDNSRRVEFEAQKNATIAGRAYAAEADKLTYSQEKDLLVLESMGYRDSELRQYPGEGRTPANLAARIIRYWPSSKKFEIGGFSRSEIN